MTSTNFAAHTWPFWPFAFGAAIFDFDGTLAASSDVWNDVDKAFLARRTLPWDPSLAQELASRGFAEGAIWIKQRFDLPESPAEICDEWTRDAQKRYAEQVELHPGAASYVAALRAAGIPIALATTNSHEVLSSLAPRIDVYSMFDVVLCSNDIERSKRHPDIYLEAASRLGVAASDCLVFEDIPIAVQSAKRVGMHTCAVYSKDSTQDFISLAQIADFSLSSWADIVRSAKLLSARAFNATYYSKHTPSIKNGDPHSRSPHSYLYVESETNFRAYERWKPEACHFDRWSRQTQRPDPRPAS